MILPFNPRASRIVVTAEVTGRQGRIRARLLLDTGASVSALSEKRLVELGYDAAKEGVHINLTTGSAVEPALQLFVKGLAALGLTRDDWPIVGCDLPEEAELDGVLGIDFFRGHILTLDFVNGILTFE